MLKFEKGFFCRSNNIFLIIWIKSVSNESLGLKLWKLIQNWTKLTKKIASKSIVLIAVDNNSTLPFILDNFHITMKYLDVRPLMDPMFAPVKTGAVKDSNGSLYWSINELVVGRAATSVVERVTNSNPWLWTLDEVWFLDLQSWKKLLRKLYTWTACCYVFKRKPDPWAFVGSNIELGEGVFFAQRRRFGNSFDA